MIIVLGPHRSGTSLVAGILNTLGVCMGSRFRTADEFNETGYWEDLDIKELNRTILKAAGGTWYDPPTQENIMGAGVANEELIYDALRRKVSQGVQGWKDPRQCLTHFCYEHWMNQIVGNASFIVVSRRIDDIVDSLMCRERIKQRRTERTKEYWRLLTNYYWGLADVISFTGPSMGVYYDMLVDEEMAPIVVSQIAKFVGIYPSKSKVDRALEMVKFR